MPKKDFEEWFGGAGALLGLFFGVSQTEHWIGAVLGLILGGILGLLVGNLAWKAWLITLAAMWIAFHIGIRLLIHEVVNEAKAPVAVPAETTPAPSVPTNPPPPTIWSTFPTSTLPPPPPAQTWPTQTWPTQTWPTQTWPTQTWPTYAPPLKRYIRFVNVCEETRVVATGYEPHPVFQYRRYRHFHEVEAGKSIDVPAFSCWDEFPGNALFLGFRRVKRANGLLMGRFCQDFDTMEWVSYGTKPGTLVKITNLRCE